MPYIVRKQGNWWLTVNAESGKIKGKHKSRKLAVSQMKLLYGIESGGWKPTGGK